MSQCFLRNTELAIADNVLSATSQDGITTAEPLADSANLGGLGLRASGIPLADTSEDVRLQRGGLPTGVVTIDDGIPGATRIWRATGGSSTSWYGHTENGFLSYARQVNIATALSTTTQISRCRRIGNGNLAYVRVTDGVSDALVFAYKSTRSGSWTSVTITNDISLTTRPDFLTLPNDRILVYAQTTASGMWAWYSDDYGVTWATWSSRTNVDLTAKAISCEYLDDVICLTDSATSTSGTATLNIRWSLDGGQSFATGSSVAAQGLAVVAVIGGRFQIAVSDTSSGHVVTYPLLVGGGVGDSIGNLGTAVAANPTFGFTAHDDGTAWGFVGLAQGGTGYPTGYVSAMLTRDNGATWIRPNGVSGNNVIFDNKTDAIGTTHGWSDFTIGSWNGAIVLLGITDDGGTTDGSIQEVWFGGPDRMTEAFVSDLKTPTGTALYNRVAWMPSSKPENMSWTKTDVGGGATTTLTASGFRIVAGAADNSYWTADTQMWAPQAGESARVRFIFDMATGTGTTAANASMLFLSMSDASLGGTDRQWILLRFNSATMKLLDNSGTLATSATVADQFTTPTEVLVAFAHDTPTPGGGTCSVWYRTTGSDVWTVLASNQAVAEELGDSTTDLIFGGLVAGSTVDWHISLVAVAEGSANMHDGFTNPTDLNGRPLSPSVDAYLDNGTSIGAYGGPGVVGDTYTVTPGYTFAARNIWLSQRPSCRWQSAVDNALTTVTFGDATNTIEADTVILVGTNFESATLQINSVNTTPGWAAPDYSVALSAAVWSGTAASITKGRLVVAGQPFSPSRFRTVPGRRWFIKIAGDVWEIADNGRSDIRVTDLPVSYGAVAFTIFGDRMGAVVSPAAQGPYARLRIASQDTADGKFRVGNVMLGMRHDIEIPYDNGFVDRWVPGAKSYSTVAGYTSTSIPGVGKHEVRMAWSIVDRLSTDYLWRLCDFFRSLDGEHRVIAFWRDMADPSTIEIHRVYGPTARENTYGELRDELGRLAEMRLVEEPA